MPPGTQPFPRVPYSMNKGQQMNTITSQVLTEIGWPIFDFHHVLSGYIEDCKRFFPFLSCVRSVLC